MGGEEEGEEEEEEEEEEGREGNGVQRSVYGGQMHAASWDKVYPRGGEGEGWWGESWEGEGNWVQGPVYGDMCVRPRGIKCTPRDMEGDEEQDGKEGRWEVRMWWGGGQGMKRKRGGIRGREGTMKRENKYNRDID
jgi:hypothetical protein